VVLGHGNSGLSNPDVAAFTQGASSALALLAVLCFAGAALIANSCRLARRRPRGERLNFRA
jgi:hypothetical protein